LALTPLDIGLDRTISWFSRTLAKKDLPAVAN
jgi:hypothetical protein